MSGYEQTEYLGSVTDLLGTQTSAPIQTGYERTPTGTYPWVVGMRFTYSFGTLPQTTGVSVPLTKHVPRIARPIHTNDKSIAWSFKCLCGGAGTMWVATRFENVSVTPPQCHQMTGLSIPLTAVVIRFVRGICPKYERCCPVILTPRISRSLAPFGYELAEAFAASVAIT